MATHSSASTRKQAPHVTQTSGTTINKALKRRAELVINNKSIDAQSRAIVRYGLEINDPWLAELVRGVEAGQTITDTIAVLAKASEEPEVSR